MLRQGKDEPMGRCTCPPIVKLNPSVAVSPKLLWFPVIKKGRKAGEMLLAAELLLKNTVGETLQDSDVLELNLYESALSKGCCAPTSRATMRTCHWSLHDGERSSTWFPRESDLWCS